MLLGSLVQSRESRNRAQGERRGLGDPGGNSCEDLSYTDTCSSCFPQGSPIESEVLVFFQNGFADRQTGREADRQTGRQADRQTGRQTDSNTGRQTDKQADKQTDRQAGATATSVRTLPHKNPTENTRNIFRVDSHRFGHAKVPTRSAHLCEGCLLNGRRMQHRYLQQLLPTRVPS